MIYLEKVISEAYREHKKNLTYKTWRVLKTEQGIRISNKYILSLFYFFCYPKGKNKQI